MTQAEFQQLLATPEPDPKWTPELRSWIGYRGTQSLASTGTVSVHYAYALEHYFAGSLDYGWVEGAFTAAMQRSSFLRDSADLATALAQLERDREVMANAPASEGSVLLAYIDHRLVYFHGLNGSWDRAQELLQRAEALQPKTSAESEGSTEMWSTLGLWHDLARAKLWMQLGLGDRSALLIEEIIPQLEVALEQEKGVKVALLDALRMRSACYLGTGRFREALDEVERVLHVHGQLVDEKSMRGDFEYNAALACELLALQDSSYLARARELLTRCSGNPQLPTSDRIESLGRLARIEVLDGNLQTAEEALMSARTMVPANNPSALIDAFLCATENFWSRSGGESSAASAQRLERLAEAAERLIADREQQPPRQGGAGFLRYRSYRFVFGEWVEALLATEAPAAVQRAFEVYLATQRVNSLARAEQAPTPSLRQIQTSLLGTGAVLLAYLPVEEGSHGFCVTQNSVQHAPLPARQDLLAWADEHKLKLALDPSRAPATPLGSALVPERFAQALQDAPCVYIVGRDFLGGLWFESLSTATGEPLGLVYNLAYLPSIAWAVQRLAAGSPFLQGEPRPVELRLIADARVATEPAPEAVGLEAFELTDPELETLTDPFATFEVRRGAAAQVAALEEVGAVQLVHIVTHGIVDRRRERPTGILLSPSPQSATGTLYAEELEALGRSAPVVFLSACSSGRGPLRTGDAEASTLTGSFLSMGASLVIATSRELRLGPTVEITGEVGRLCAAGSSPAGALRAARVSLQSSGHGDLREWAGIHAIGIAHLPILADSQLGPRSRGRISEEQDLHGKLPWRLLLGAAAVVCLLLGLGLRRRPKAPA